MQMPKPSEQHQRLQRLVGTWSGEETMKPSPWDPRGGTAAAKIVSRTALDGMHVVTDYEQKRDGTVTFEGHGVFGYDAPRETYTMYWFDSMGFDPGGPARGRWENDTLSFEHETTMGRSRYIHKLLEEDRYEFRIEMSQDGEHFQTWMSATYHRS